MRLVRQETWMLSAWRLLIKLVAVMALIQPVETGWNLSLTGFSLVGALAPKAPALAGRCNGLAWLQRISWPKFLKPPTDTACPQQSPIPVPPSKHLDTDKKRRGVGDPSLISEARPAGREVMIRQPLQQ